MTKEEDDKLYTGILGFSFLAAMGIGCIAHHWCSMDLTTGIFILSFLAIGSGLSLGQGD